MPIRLEVTMPESRDYEAWFRAEDGQGLEELKDTNLVLVADEEMQVRWEVERTVILKEIGVSLEP